jgi:hypothetical protein
MGRDGDLAQGDAVTRKARSAQRVTRNLQRSRKRKLQEPKGKRAPMVRIAAKHIT